MRAAQKPVHEFGNAVVSAQSRIAGAVSAMGAARAGLAGVAGAMGFRELAQEINALDEMARRAEALGIVTNELIGLRHAAQMAGMEWTSFLDSLKTFRSHMGKAIAAVGEQKSAFAKLGLDPASMSKMGLVDAVGQFADALNRVPDAATRMALAQQVFEETGYRIIPLLNKGSEGIQQMVKDAERLGLTVSDVDLEQMRAAKESLDEMSAAWQGMKREATIASAPIAKTLMQITTGAMAMTRLGVGQFFSGPEAASQARGMENAAEKAQELFDAMQRGEELTKAAIPPLRKYRDTIGELRVLLDQAAISQEVYNYHAGKALDDYIQADPVLSNVRRILEDSATVTERYTRDALDMHEALRRGSITAEQFHRGIGQVRKEMQDAVPAWQETQAAIDETLTPMDRYMRRVEALTELFRAEAISQEQWAEHAAAAWKMLRKESGAVEMVDRNRTPGEILQRDAKKAAELRKQGLISQKTYSRELARLQKQWWEDSGGRDAWEQYADGIKEANEQYKDFVLTLGQSNSGSLALSAVGWGGGRGGGGLRPVGSAIPHIVPPQMQIPETMIPHTASSMGMVNGMAVSMPSAVGGPPPVRGGAVDPTQQQMLVVLQQIAASLRAQERNGVAIATRR